MRWTACLVVTFASLLAAGCSNPTPSPAAETAPSGTLAVRVVDTELLPLDEARVWIDGEPANGTSDAGGLVVIEPLAPGRHEVRANRTGYWDNTTHVTVVLNETTELWVELEQVPGPYDVWGHERARPYCGFVLPPRPDETEPRCRSPLLGAGPSAALPFEPGLRGVVLRMDWDASSEASTRMTFNVSLRETTFANGTQFFTVEGPSPIRVQLDAPVVPKAAAETWGNLSVVIRTPEWDPARPFVDQPVEVRATFQYRIWPDLDAGPNGS